MARIAFLLIAHRDPGRLIDKVRALTAHGDCVAIHFDARAPEADWRALRTGLAGLPDVAFAPRVRCGWGEFSLVRATLALIHTARRAFRRITHHFLISGDCYPTKSRGYLDRYLVAERDVIEAHDFFASDWIKTGLKEERLIYRHWFNERGNKRLFDASLVLQRRLGLTRRLPRGIAARIGSQWWVLRAATVERILEFCRNRPDVVRFFRTTWIPDETFFQTLVAHLLPPEEITGHPPTHLAFSDYGMPVVFHADHADYLAAEPAPFARKISRHSTGLHRALLDRFGQAEADGAVGGAPSRLYPYLASRGRVGARYGPRFWEAAIGDRREAGLLIVAAKLWHVGRSVERAAAQAAGVPGLGYVFSDEAALGLSLGGFERGLAKRNRHRQAFLNMAFEALEARRLMLCVDTCQTDAIDEMMRRFGDARLLLVERPVEEDRLLDHARHAGLVGPASGAFELGEVRTALRQEFRAEADGLRRRYAGRVFLNTLDREREANTIDLVRFLGVGHAAAETVARKAERWR